MDPFRLPRAKLSVGGSTTPNSSPRKSVQSLQNDYFRNQHFNLDGRSNGGVPMPWRNGPKSSHSAQDFRLNLRSIVEPPRVFLHSPIFLAGQDVKGIVSVKLNHSHWKYINVIFKDIRVNIAAYVDLIDSRVQTMNVSSSSLPTEIRRGSVKPITNDTFPIRLTRPEDQVWNFQLKTTPDWPTTLQIHTDMGGHSVTCRQHISIQATVAVQIEDKRTGQMKEDILSSAIQEVAIHSPSHPQNNEFAFVRSRQPSMNAPPVWTWTLELGWKGKLPMEVTIEMPMTRQYERNDILSVNVRGTLSTRDRFYNMSAALWQKLELPQSNVVHWNSLISIENIKFSQRGPDVIASVSMDLTTLQALQCTFDSPLMKLNYLVELKSAFGRKKLLKIVIPIAIVLRRDNTRPYSEEVTHDWGVIQGRQACLLM